MQDESQRSGEATITEDTHLSSITVGPIRLDTLQHVVTVDDNAVSKKKLDIRKGHSVSC